MLVGCTDRRTVRGCLAHFFHGSACWERCRPWPGSRTEDTAEAASLPRNCVEAKAAILAAVRVIMTRVRVELEDFIASRGLGFDKSVCVVCFGQSSFEGW